MTRPRAPLIHSRLKSSWHNLIPGRRGESAVRCFSTSGISALGSGEMGPKLTHLDATGRASMVDVAGKEPTRRTAVAMGRIYIPEVAYELVTATYPAGHGAPGAALEAAKAKARSKGDVLTVAQLAGIMGSKRTADLIPLCHPLQLSHIAVTLQPEEGQDRSASGSSGGREASCRREVIGDPDVGASCQAGGVARRTYSILCRAEVACEGRTGVEMEALTAVSVGLLTVWDMLKAVAGREMVIGDVAVVRKAGGSSGDFVREL
ncbi:uncharacterized protein FIBRA_05902 [Fibroporia radiculosa]|uniref:Molybdopterin cofactor biosynthesis C (MoaC) domain-containing protein n=1 Tax=Fibroporia radiculosa TaxID=599839 RepID=J4IAZ2_9APHY|nr:uncharacterized protein FIBRA_05902 [Fibroporia radiculosa]CCM03756.1 predicted protein [Fibroporia radiculosa]